MSRDELWKIYSDKNPSFNGSGQITMSAEGLRKLFGQTWEKAEESGRCRQKIETALRDAAGMNSPRSNPFGF